MKPCKHALVLLSLLLSCARAPRGSTGLADPIAVTFSPLLGAAPLRCGQPAQLNGNTVELVDLRFYVHDLELVDAHGAAVPVAFDEDGAFQTARLALIDLEDGSAACRNGSPALHATIRGRTRRGAFTLLRGRLGVPFEMNHGDPAQDPPPLAPTAMQWSWLGGHTFLRFDVRLQGRPLSIHLGSYGCSGEIGHVQGCRWPNRPRFEVPLSGSPSASIGPIPFDLLPLLRAALAAGPESRGCMGDPEAPGCVAVFAALGLSARDGTAAGLVQGLGGR